MPSLVPDLELRLNGTNNKDTSSGEEKQEMLLPPQNFMRHCHSMFLDPMLGLQQFPLFAGQLPQIPPPQSAPQPVPQPVVHQSPPRQNGVVVDAGSAAMKEVISCASCTLYPPNPAVPAPTTRERPPGCRTVFVGGLPESISEETIREIFERCGEITTLRLSSKNFCHIRFALPTYVDSAIYLSGYRVRLGQQADAASCGRLHVDYAQARDDQYDWECKQRQLQREQRHRERVERDRLRLSPPLVVHYTDHEAGSVCEKLKQDETFGKAVQTLQTWLERGDCNKKNAHTLYNAIQVTNSHVRRLAHEKQGYDEELRKAKDSYKIHMQAMGVQGE